MRNARRALAPSLNHAAGIVAAAIAVFGGRAFAQEVRSTELDLLFPRSRQGEAQGSTATAPEISAPLDAAVDPATYRMVPGDLVQVEIGGEADRSWRLAVSPEGRLLLPGAGSVAASGGTLASVATSVREALAERFPGKPVDLYLLQPGAFRVYVTGAVAAPGVQIVHAYDRVAWAISTAGGPLPGASLRAIMLRPQDGPEGVCDLVDFVWSGDLAANPQLSPGLTIHVPAATDFVRVTGAVRGVAGADRGIIPNVGSRIPETPRIVLEWRDGDTIGFCLLRAGGLSEDATGTILLLREGQRRMLTVELADTARTRPGDLIEAALRDRFVFVTGAVRYPGPYPHLPSMVASDYVRLAGGPSEIGRGNGWKLLSPANEEIGDAEQVTYIVPGSTVVVPERWTYEVSTLLAPISGISALVISVIALWR